MHTTSIKNVSNIHEEWKNNVTFYRDELKVFRGQLNEVAEKNNTRPILERIEHFQNQFDIHDEKMAQLIHEIDLYIHQVYHDTQTMANHVSKETQEQSLTLESKVKIGENLFEELKLEFRKFLEKVL
jgi:hypothetical protein